MAESKTSDAISINEYCVIILFICFDSFNCNVLKVVNIALTNLAVGKTSNYF